MNQHFSIKKNFIYKSLLTVSIYCVGFIIFPYISRVLGVEKVGLVDFVDNTINYFLLFATLGINILGVREIAGCKDDPKELSKVFSNILILNLIFTFLVLIIYICAVLFIPQLYRYHQLFYIGIAKILFSLFLIEWFFAGIENFRYITIRSVIIKIIYAVAIFLFIKKSEDYILYFIFTTLIVVLNGIINVIYARKFVSFTWSSEIFSYFKSNILVGSHALMYSMYTILNVMFLGFISTTTQVGYYTTAFRLYVIIMGFFGAFTNVMLPRMSALLAKGEKENFQTMVNKSFSLLFIFCIPLAILCTMLAPQIIYILAGKGYEGAILPMRIIMPLIVIEGITQIFVYQVLLPLKQDRFLFIVSVLGGLLGLVLNIIIVPKMSSIGSAIVLLIAESCITLLYSIIIHKKGILKFPWKSLIQYIIYALPCILICLVCNIWIQGIFFSLISACIVSVLYLGILHYWLGTSEFIYLLKLFHLK